MIFETANIDPVRGHELLKLLVVPRPIAWVTTLRENDVVNVAPFSCFSILGFGPMLVGLGFERVDGIHKKDTLKNIERTSEFVIHSVTEELLEQMVSTARPAPFDESKVKTAGLTLVPSRAILVPRIAECATAMECRAEEIKPIGTGHDLVIARVLTVHLDDECFPGGLPDYTRFRPVARMHDEFYVRLGEIVHRPRSVLRSPPRDAEPIPTELGTHPRGR